MKLPWAKTFSVFYGVLLSLVASFPVAAQIKPDATLPHKSLVTPKLGNIFQIDGGTRAGSNLFHSFTQFNVPTGGTAFFNNAQDVTNIFSRVTGNTVSNIDGILKANGTASLFLLNPNGIIFGQNAQLKIGGSFVGTTANAIVFGNLGIFSASSPNNPAPLLTVNPDAFLFNQIAAQSIASQANLQVNDGSSLLLLGGNVSLDGAVLKAPGGRVELGGLTGTGTVGLKVDGTNLGLTFPLGVPRADVSLSNNAEVNVRAGGGGSIAVNAQNFQMLRGSKLRAGIAANSGSAGSQAGDIDINATDAISIDNGSLIFNGLLPGATGNGGNVDITTKSFSLTNNAVINTSTYGQGNSGTLNINAHDTVSVDGSVLYNLVSGIGNSGGININTGSLSVTNAELNTSVVNGGLGNGGNIIINARDNVTFDGGFAFLRLEKGGIGRGGDIRINTGSLLLTGVPQDIADANIGQIVVVTWGQGDAGSVTIKASNSITLDGQGSKIWSLVGRDRGIGNGGNINITTSSLSLNNGGDIDTSTEGQGNAGNLEINTKLLSLDRNSAISTRTYSSGKGGDTNIQAEFVSIKNNSFIRIGTEGSGNSSSLKIQTEQLSLESDGSVEGDVNIDSTGKGADIYLDVKGKILLNGGITASTGESTRITLGVLPGGIGSGGNLQINAGSLVMTNGAIIKDSSQGKGDAGNINISAGVVDISGSVPSSGLPSGIFTGTDTSAKAGNILINTGSFRLADGAALSARTRGSGKGGNIAVNATNTFEAVNGGQLLSITTNNGQAGNIVVNANQITLSGSDPNYSARLPKLFNPVFLLDPFSNFVANRITETGAASGFYVNTTPSSTASGGTLSITAGQLKIQNGAQITASSQGSGSAGNMINITAPSLNLNNGFITTTSTSGEGGNIKNIDVQDLRLRNHSYISTSAGTNNSGGGNGGNITFNTETIVDLENSNIAANAYGGRGGNIQINTQGLFNSPDSPITASSQYGVNGLVHINRPDLDPSQGLVILPEKVVDNSRSIAQGCSTPTGENGSRFIVSGSGGLPPNPTAPLSADAVVEDVRLPSMTAAISPSNSVAKPLVEATGWVVNEKGEVVLVADAPKVTPHNPWTTPPNCQGNS